MNYRNFFLINILFLFTNCVNDNLLIDKQNIKIEDAFSNKGFALVYNQKYHNAGLVSNKIGDRDLVIFQKNLQINTQVKITNISNNKSIIAKVGKDSNYPIFNNSVISIRIAKELDLNIDEPYIEILEIPKNSMFIAKKAKTFDEEKNVAKKAPVKSISINDLNEINTIDNTSAKKKFSYTIKVADFYFIDTAQTMIDRIIRETKILNPKIKKITKEKYRVYLGPFSNINSLQKSYNDINILEFENIEIIKND